MKAVLAIDLGASSGRAVAYTLQDKKIVSEEIARFPNHPKTYRGHLCWDIQSLQQNIVEAIQKTSEKYDCASIGVDTFGVDFVQVDSQGALVTQPVCYRDARTQGILNKIARYSSLDDLYYKTGNQLMEINTLYQLVVTKEQSPETYYRTDKILMISDYINYLLTGNMAIERSIASTTQMLNPLTKTWNEEVLSNFEISKWLFPKLVREGHLLGQTPQGIQVINVCQHDTASAVVAIPPLEGKTLYISCGTWSLIGTELAHPLLTEKALRYGFTNEMGHSGTTRFLKNCTGLWFIEELRRAYQAEGQNFDFETITQMVQGYTEDVDLVDTEDECFFVPGNMLQILQTYLEEQGKKVDSSPAYFFKVIYHSLAYKYKGVIKQLEELLDYDFIYLNLIGGGSKSSYFAQLIADVTDKIVVTGLSEATSLGNALIQFVALGYINNLGEAKNLVKQSISFKHYYPKKRSKTYNEKLS